MRITFEAIAPSTASRTASTVSSRSAGLDEDLAALAVAKAKPRRGTEEGRVARQQRTQAGSGLARRVLGRLRLLRRHLDADERRERRVRELPAPLDLAGQKPGRVVVRGAP